ncbi:MAG: glycosyltransferase family 2 protein [Gammaproteobacteria bacterium]|nr:MAG: glycosyltransferase family 2 protein [Gammaproteobacteria bacterium]
MLAEPGADRAATRIAVVVPCYRVSGQVLEVLAAIGPEVERIYCVDDACPDGSGRVIEQQCDDPRVCVVYRERNGGVGAAVKTGYARALQDGATVVVKLDGDGQMDPALIPRFVAPVLAGRADYTKGNRFYRLESLRSMPARRKLGNAGLSFLSKLSSGYWSLFDPTNGYTAIHGRVLSELPLARISDDWFFESDMLFRLNTLGAVVEDLPMEATYGGEQSNLRIRDALLTFPRKHGANFCKRIFYNYFLRNFSIASLQLVIGALLLGFGVIFGSVKWWQAIETQQAVTAGTVMLAALPTLLGVELLLAFLNYDIGSQPRVPLHRKLDAL